MIKALSNSTVKQLLFESTNKRLDKVEEQVTKTDETVSDMQIRMDELEQDKRDRNIIISRLQPDKTSKNDVAKALTDILKCSITPSDIDYTYKITKADQQPTRVKVVLKQKAKKSEIVKEKIKLKDKTTIWISDDLTPHRSRMAYLARQAVKTGKAIKTWVYDSQIFLQIPNHDRPKRIKFTDDIPK
jgi:hypothetical protein